MIPAGVEQRARAVEEESLEKRLARLEMQVEVLLTENAGMKQAFATIFASANAMMTAELAFLK